jgi:hypothetical protein
MEPHEQDSRLGRVSDTEIVLNFVAALEALYPRMRSVFAHCYDPFDEIVEPLFQSLVYGRFGAKYGVAVPESRCHRYEFERSSYADVHYVRVVPKDAPPHEELVLVNFGDGRQPLTAGEGKDDYAGRSFHLTRCVRIDRKSRAVAPESSDLRVPNEDVSYEFVKTETA